MSPPTHPSHEFLGVNADATAPLELLGLTPADLGEDAVIRALQGQLARVAQSPRADTLEADEVRLQLHAAAARLLDPTLRRQFAPRGAPPAGGPTVPEASVLLTLGMFGGWNSQSLRRLAMIAESQGVPPDRVVAMVQDLMGHGAERATPAGTPPGARPAAASAPASAPARPGPGAAPVAGSARAPEPDEGMPRAIKVILGFGLAGLAAMVGVSVTLVVLLSDPPPEPAGPGPAVAKATPAPEPPPRELFPAPPEPPATPPKPKPAPVRLGDFTDVLRALDASVAGTAVDLAGALDAFEKAAGDAETRWMEAAPDAQLAAINSALDFLYRLGDNEEAGARAAGILARGSRGVAGAGPVPPRAIGPAVWSAGVLTRLSRERDLPTGVREELRARFAECFGRGAAPGDFTFRSGAAAMALSLPPRLVQAAESGAAPSAGWSAWQRVVDALSGVDAELAIRLKVHALEGLLVSSPEPTQDQGVFEGVTLLTTGLTWRKGEASRRALLRWFDSPGVSNADLNTLTSALATRSGAEGVDYSMVLSPNAGESQRAEMRARYATVWGLDAQESRESLSEAWRQAAEALLNSGTPSDPAQWLERAVRQSRLNEAATRLWRGDLDGVGEAIRAAGESISAAAQPPGPVGGVPGPRLPQMDAASASGSWAVRYLGARQHIGQRREILATVATIPNALEAEVLVEEACRGTPQSVRADARAIVLRFADEPTVINALLEFAPFMPPTNDNAELVRTVSAAPVPRPRDPGFRVAVRRALVERLMQKLSGMGDLAYVDRLAEELADSYAARAPRAPDGAASLDPSASPSTRARPTPEAAARAERVRLRREAESAIASGREPFTLSDLDNRRAARERVAQGRVQVFAVEQTGVSELLAFVVVAESPTRAQAVAEVVRELDDRRRGAGHVFEQLEAAERAAVKLWRLRYAPGGAS